MNKIEFFVRLGQIAERFNAKTQYDVRGGVGTLTLPATPATQILAQAMYEEASAFVPPHLCETRGGVLTATCPA